MISTKVGNYQFTQHRLPLIKTVSTRSLHEYDMTVRRQNRCRTYPNGQM